MYRMELPALPLETTALPTCTSLRAPGHGAAVKLRLNVEGFLCTRPSTRSSLLISVPEEADDNEGREKRRCEQREGDN
jgi:hypothetical protein